MPIDSMFSYDRSTKKAKGNVDPHLLTPLRTNFSTSAGIFREFQILVPNPKPVRFEVRDELKLFGIDKHLSLSEKLSAVHTGFDHPIDCNVNSFDFGSQMISDSIRDCIATAFPNRRIADAQVLSGGLINTNIKIEFGSHQPPVVLRLYQGDSGVCLKETAVLRLVHPTVPVPEVIHVEPNGINGSRPFSILEFVNGITFQELQRTRDIEAIHQAAASVGKTLACIGVYQFLKPGILQTDLEKQLMVGDGYSEDPDPVPRLLDLFLQSEDLQRRLDSSFRQELHIFIWSWAARLRELNNERHLVHCDFGNRNILVDCKNKRWQVVAVLDWEFSLSGTPLLDVGHFLRYDRGDVRLREPFFSRAFVEFGGVVSADWRRVSQVLDLTGLVHCLTHRQLPDDVTREILQLIKSTLESCKL